jgi:hypothetical protein
MIWRDFMNVKEPIGTHKIWKSNLSVRKHGGSDIDWSTHLIDCTKNLNVPNFSYSCKKKNNTLKTWPTMCVSYANKGKTQVRWAIGQKVQIWARPNNNPPKRSPYRVLDLDEMCCNFNIGFAIKYGVQGPMKPKKCV